MPENVAAAPAATPAPAAAPANQQAPANANQPADKGNAGAAPPKVEQPEFFEVPNVNGKTVRLTREQAIAELRRSAAATERFQKASEQTRKYEQWKETAKQDALKALMDPELGLSKEQIRDRFESWYHENFIAPKTMSKEQLEALEWKKKAQEYEEREKARMEQETKAREEWQSQQMREHVQKELIETMEKGGFDKTKFNMNRIAFWTKQNLKQGFNAPPEHVAAQVRNEFKMIVKESYKGKMENPTELAKALREDFGDDLIKAIRKLDMEEWKARNNKNPQSPPPDDIGNRNFVAGTPGQNRREGQRKTMRDVDQYFNRLRFER